MSPSASPAWQKQHLYAQIRAARAGAPKYILHDGPPYANGAIHLGHALNKCIKDFVVKTKTMDGFDAPYVPGWDCHGLPIEIKVDEQLGRKKLEMPPIAVRRACREYAQKYVDLQRTQFERIGVFGRWDTPYLTMSNGYEASIVETFYDFFEKDFVYKGLRPVYWCIHDRTALAEAEVEYEQHTSPSIYVRYKLASDPETVHAALAGKQVYTIIWTTTPWTLPASQAVAFHPHLEYVAIQTADATYIVAEALLPSIIANCNLMSGKDSSKPASAERRHRPLPRQRTRRRDLPPPLPRPRHPRRHGRLRHRGPRHWRRPHLTCPRRRRLRHRQALQPARDPVRQQRRPPAQHRSEWWRRSRATLRRPHRLQIQPRHHRAP